MSDIKHIDLKEFWEKGYLQEVNRLFFHPLGLALEVRISENGEVTLGGIWDYREDPEGIIYDIANLSDSEKAEMKTKANYITAEFKKRDAERIVAFGNRFEPIK